MTGAGRQTPELAARASADDDGQAGIAAQQRYRVALGPLGRRLELRGALHAPVVDAIDDVCLAEPRLERAAAFIHVRHHQPATAQALVELAAALDLDDLHAGELRQGAALALRSLLRSGEIGRAHV